MTHLLLIGIMNSWHKKSFGILALFLFVLTISCKQQIQQEITAETRIKQLEDSLFTDDGRMKLPEAERLVKAYKQFASEKPTDSLSPVYLFKAIDISMNLPNPKRSIALVDQFIQQYPDHASIPNALFVKAFIFDDQLRDYENAKKAYLLFIERYPDHALADDAAEAIKNLGKTPEEIIREFEAKNQ